jgi:leucyl-tRNA synthetase
MSYQHTEIDQKWQQAWENQGAFRAADSSPQPKFYALDMFPYPSGTGLHVGHLASYMPADIVSRYKRARGFNVLHPMGYDAFGLPAEQFAIQTGVHPAVTTEKAIASYRQQLQAFGFSFDWSREISTAEPNFYKWTQFIFTKLFERGLAYQKEVPVNWCPAMRTVLANEEVVDGKSERGGHPVIRLPMKQWMLKITSYAERLANDLDQVDWPERTREGQRNWIGRSEGANLFFQFVGFADKLEVFTTRPDTLFGVTFMVVAPEHPVLETVVPASHRQQVQAYRQQASRKSELDRKANADKSGVDTGAVVTHPITGEQIPVWTADYVLMDYGTGAIMAVPGHDARDFEFAEKFALRITRVLNSEAPLPFEGEGELVNSQFLNGLSQNEAIRQMINHAEAKQFGRRNIQYKLRDWLFSRQRYWGEPFPIVEFSDGALHALPVDELPVVLPPVADYEPSEKGEPPLARAQEWVHYVDPKSGREGRRITDTMPGSAGSSWYFLRYIDPHNNDQFCDFEKQKYWMPVDLYVGGPEHTVGHLLYARFWQKVLFDAGLVSHEEPFAKLAHQGMILGADNEKMSKSRGNVVTTEEVGSQYGADAVRMYITFLGPLDRDKPWSTNGIDGVRRFLERVWRLCLDDSGHVVAQDMVTSPEINKVLHKTVKKVTDDIEGLNFNTAVSAMMILVNELYKSEVRPKSVLLTLLQILAPFAPHVCEELWQRLGGTGFVSLAPWPTYDPTLVVDETVSMGVQVNGKMRGTIEISASAEEKEAVSEALKVTAVANAIGDKKVTKVIYKAGRILNLIVS